MIGLRSRILNCKQLGRVIAKLLGRVQITDHTQKLEFQQAAELPSDFPQTIDVIEMSRLVIDKKVDQKMAIMHLFKRCLYVAVESERNWIIASVEEGP